MNIIEARGVTKFYGRTVALSDVSFSVPKGCIFGLLGPNGAGKTTLISVLTTLLRPTHGTVKVCGYNIINEGKEVRKIIGVVFQDFLLDEDLTAFDNLDIHARLYKLDKEERQQAILRVLKIVGLENEQKNKAGTFSGGMKRRLEIARGLLGNPKVLFLDEPTLGLDPEAKRNVWEHIITLNQKQGVTILIATNNMEEAEKLCTKVAILNRGKIIRLGAISQLKRSLKKGASLEDVLIHLTGRETK